jgi:hypothetical protein
MIPPIFLAGLPAVATSREGGDKLVLRSTQAGMMVRAAPTRVIDAGKRCASMQRPNFARCLKDHSRRQFFEFASRVCGLPDIGFMRV